MKKAVAWLKKFAAWGVKIVKKPSDWWWKTR